jgi:amidophosphoribosyltransferase
MSDALKHECGVAMLRLRKPLEFYKEKYGTSFYALKKCICSWKSKGTEGKMVLA